MRKRHRWSPIALAAGLLFLLPALAPTDAGARRPIRNAFFGVYPQAVGSRLDNLASSAGHCGACHFDFNGGGPRNPYGLAVEVAINSGNHASTALAIQAIESLDSDGDGFSQLVEILDTTSFSNTPTFPGLTPGNVGQVSNVNGADLQGYLVPAGGSDTDPPVVAVSSPAGGSFAAGSDATVLWTTSDASAIAHVDLYLSSDGGAEFKQIAAKLPDSGSASWFVPNLPSSQSVLRVAARDAAGNYGSGDSAPFTITGTTGGTAPTTLADMELPGSQPFEGKDFDDPDAVCASCHGNYDTAVEPWHNWKGSMMAQAARDPLFLACVAVAEQDAPSVGDLCIRCHSPEAWLNGRSLDTSGNMLTADDRQGIHCDFCHSLVDPHYEEGVSPASDADVIAALRFAPGEYPGNGSFVVDPAPVRRGPYADAQASHQFLDSPFHRESALCGTCHDVSNPVFDATATAGDFVPNAFGERHPTGATHGMLPIERTFSEWSRSAYANGGVHAPQFAGAKADGIVGSCQDCHMSDVVGKGSNVGGSPNRSDMGLHDLTGGNHFVPDILADFWPGEVDPARLAAGKARAIAMLQKAASLELGQGQQGGHPVLTVRVTNETGHKLPSGYPEGRRVWVQVRGYESPAKAQLLYESGAYDVATGELTHDADLALYEVHPGLSPGLAGALGLPPGPSFHFVLNDTVYSDNRIPPRGFSNSDFEEIQSPVVDYSYADGQYWDDLEYELPTLVRFAEVTLYYQATSKEYIEFLRDENVSNDMGQRLHDAWVAQGRAAPVAMATDTLSLDPLPTGTGDIPLATRLLGAWPNPANPRATVQFELARAGRVELFAHDAAGRRLATLTDRRWEAGRHALPWGGTDDHGAPLASGVYYLRLRVADTASTLKLVLVR